MKATKQLWKVLALLLAIGLFAAACGSDDDDSSQETSAEEEGDDTAAEEEAPAEEATEEEATEEAAEEEAMDGGIVSFGIIEPSWIDSFNVQDSEGFQVARLLYDGLTDFDEDLNAIPAIATDWASDDNIVWTFNLRDDVVFHDGNPVTAQSFVDAFNRVADPENLSDVSYYGSYIAGIEGWEEVEAGEATEVVGVVAVDDTTLEITLNGPYSLLPKAMAHPVFSPVSPDYLASPDTDNPVGNGPYMMDGPWEHNVGISVARFDDYYGTPGTPDGIDFGIYESQETMYLDAQAGNLDISDIPPEQIVPAQEEFGERYLEVAIGAYNYLGFPNDIPPFDNPDIRKALSLGIDRETITEQIFAGTRDPASAYAPLLAPGAVPNCTNCVYDPDTAVELYEAAGGIPGNTVTIYFNSGGGHEEWLQAVANGWKQLFDLDAEFVGQEFSPYLDQLQAGEIDGPYRLGWLWDVPSAENFLSPLFLSASTDNYSGYENSAFDDAITAFKEAPTEEEGFPALEEAQEILNEDMPVAPAFFTRAQKVFTERVANVVHSVFDFTYLENVEVVG